MLKHTLAGGGGSMEKILIPYIFNILTNFILIIFMANYPKEKC